MKVEINIIGNALEVETKRKAAQEIVDNLDCDSIIKIAQLSKNEKFIKNVKNPPAIVKSYLGM